MSLFRKPQKMITDRELDGTAFHQSLFSGLRHGDRDTRLNSRELSTLKAMVEAHRDEDRGIDSHHMYKGINEKEVDQLIEQVKSHPDFGEKKAAHIEEHLKHYLSKRY
ncbi:MAG: hypothetical protein WCT49_03705 [Candidatus Paceibacterota bacterium]|jgi:hypothetical protein|nr:hypothetical protein [Candidatus Paceibacterota bacterium]